MINQELVETFWNGSNRKHYEHQGYSFTRMRDPIVVRVIHLPENSNIPLEVVCDYCGDKFERSYYKVIRGRLSNPKDACGKCKHKKIKETNVLKFGVENPFQSKDVITKIQNTNLSRYGAKYGSMTDEVKRKARDTSMLRYGVVNPAKSDIIKQRIRDRIKENWGVDYISQHPEKSEQMASSNRLGLPYITEFIMLNGCTLLDDEYVSTTAYINITCKCGKIFRTTFSQFVHDNKRQCNECGRAKISGENAPNWKGGVTSLAELFRKRREYADWRISVYKRDDFTCQSCKRNNVRLHAHHILSFSEYPEKRLDVDNGITLCEKCHNPIYSGSFHNIFGTRKNNKEQLDMFLSVKV